MKENNDFQFDEYHKTKFKIEYIEKGNKCIGVYKAEKISQEDEVNVPNKFFAIKVVKIIDLMKGYEDTLNHIIKQIKHENIMAVYQLNKGVGKFAGKSVDVVYIYMEFLGDEYESISDFIKRRRKEGGIQEKEISNIATGIMYSLLYLRLNNITHRDIKSDNILINRNGVIKLIDLDYSKYYQSGISDSTTKVGTPLYVPEMKERTKNSNVDIVALGRILIELAGGTLEEKSTNIPQNLSKKYINFVQNCDLQKQCRPKVFKLINHEFLSGDISPLNQFYRNETIFQPSKQLYLSNLFLEKMEESDQYHKITHITLTDFNESTLIIDKLPSVTSLTLKSFDKPITEDLIPEKIKYLKLSKFNQEDSSLINIPTSVTHLTLKSFNHPITTKFPNSIKYLKLNKFNQNSISLKNIPESVTHLYLKSFNNSFTHDDPSLSKDPISSIPETVYRLKLGNFDYEKYGTSIPDHITIFSCSYSFQTPINISDPIQTILLSLKNCNHIPTKLPDNVFSLKLGSNFSDFSSLSNIPKSVSTISFGVKNYNDEKEKVILNSLSSTNVTGLIVNGKNIELEK